MEASDGRRSNMSQALRKMQYAVRGEVVMKADALEQEGREILYTNVGNPHSVGQKPLTFFRQVLALCDLPAEHGVDHPNASAMFPADAIARARDMRAAIGDAGTGSYTNSQGIAQFRGDVARFIERRDGHPARPEDIFLTNGASSAIQHVLTACFASDHDALMIPIPQRALGVRSRATRPLAALDAPATRAISGTPSTRRWSPCSAAARSATSSTRTRAGRSTSRRSRRSSRAPGPTVSP